MVNIPEATTALLEKKITVIPSSSTVVTTPASQIIGTETEEQDLTNLEPQSSNANEMCTPSSASLVLENYIASTPASFVADLWSASSCTSGASVVSTPLSTAYSCKDCTHGAKKNPQFTESQQSTENKSADFKRGSVKPEEYHHRAHKYEFHLSLSLCHKQFANLSYMCYTFTVCVHQKFFTGLLALHIFSPSQQNYDLQIFPFVLFHFSI